MWGPVAPWARPPALPHDSGPGDRNVPVARAWGRKLPVTDEAPGHKVVLGAACRERRRGGPRHPPTPADQGQGHSTECPESGTDGKGAVVQEVLAASPGSGHVYYGAFMISLTSICALPSVHEPPPPWWGCGSVENCTGMGRGSWTTTGPARPQPPQGAVQRGQRKQRSVPAPCACRGGHRTGRRMVGVHRGRCPDPAGDAQGAR